MGTFNSRYRRNGYQLAPHELVDAAALPQRELEVRYAVAHQQIHDLLDFLESHGLLEDFAAAFPHYVGDVSDA